MTETSLHPRPDFATFLQSDSNGVRDSVSYYERQRTLRFQKVTILQQKRENAYVPGYRKKRPATVPAATTLAERAEAFTKFGRPKSATTHHVSINPYPVEIEPKPLPRDQEKGNYSPFFERISQPSIVLNQRDSKQENGFIKPIIFNKQRNIKSATPRNEEERSHEDGKIQKQRPVTVPGDVMRDDAQHIVSKELGANGKSQGLSSILKKADMKDVKEPVSAMTDAETQNLYKAYQWGTSTQRAYNDAGWEDKMDTRVKERPTAGFRNLPDPVTHRLTYRRYNSDPAFWQSFGCNWDYIQPRRGDTYTKGPQSILFNSTYPAMQQIPGYSGCSPVLAKHEFDQATVPPPSIVRSIKPHYTDISRRGNIPGYTGRIHWSNPNRAHADIPFPEPTTSARIHREIPVENEVSPFRRDGVLSRMVTTVPPKNPFRRIQY